MPTPPHELTILFADIVGSSRLYIKEGNARAEALIHAALEEAARLTVEAGGEVIKTLGDAVLGCFARPAQAADTALALQREFAHSPSGIAWRIGFHHGSTVRRDGDVFGDAVNVAARIGGLAKSQQILTTDSTLAQLEPAHAQAARLLQRVELRGRPGAVGLCELLSDLSDLTVGGFDSIDSLIAPRKSKESLLVSLGADQRVLTRSGGTFLVGRDARCDFVVESDKTSRTHVRIEGGREGFVATDQSTNGTLLSIDGRLLLLRRDSARLLGAGWISPAGKQALPRERRLWFTAAQDSTPALPVSMVTGEAERPA